MKVNRFYLHSKQFSNLLSNYSKSKHFVNKVRKVCTFEAKYDII
uniref:YabG peptidase U57 n=1 Tax=Myoviridae sp. ctbEa13 TaxID=2825136 RepID=A0A8S5VBT6_9CAUD|nr:MAG TPA: YabG peptidase U57 [Myoviridae sp. ctbEa13]